MQVLLWGIVVDSGGDPMLMSVTADTPEPGTAVMPMLVTRLWWHD